MRKKARDLVRKRERRGQYRQKEQPEHRLEVR